MPVYRLDLAYDGTGFHGYARQPGVRTVQGELERALAVLVPDVGETVVAGRTDAGVHARGQVVSFAADRDLDTTRLFRSLNSMTPPDLGFTAVQRAPDHFDARFSAVARHYRYRVLRRTTPDPLRRLYTWHVPDPLDPGAMSEVCAALVGEHDFASFCRKAEGKTTVRTVLSAGWQTGGEVIHLDIRASAFCHQMVRSIVAVCVAAGRGRLDPARIPAILQARDRGAARGAAPPHGLVLWEVEYPEEDMA